jgi:hypothetical protein
MSRKRVRWLVAVLLVFAIALAALWWFYLRPPYGVTKRSFAKIQQGMTLERAETIIGSKSVGEAIPGFIFHGVGACHLRVLPKGSFSKNWWVARHWLESHRILTVYLEDGIVVGKEYTGPESPGFLSQLWEVLGV